MNEIKEYCIHFSFYSSLGEKMSCAEHPCAIKINLISSNYFYLFRITTVFSHAQTVVVCAGCSTVLCQPTGGKAR